MRRSVVAASVVFAALIEAVVLSAAPVEPWKQLYADGRVAYEARDYEGAVAKFEAAVAAQPAEMLNAVEVSGKAEDYLPHLYMGLAFDKLKRPSDALRELTESQRQGVIQKHGYLVTLVAEMIQEEKKAEARSGGSRQTVRPTATAAPSAKGPTNEALTAVREGIRTYFKSRYFEASRQLDPYRDQVPVARVFYAYALVGAELLKPSVSAEVVSKARTEYRQALLDGAPKPDVLISPAITDLLTR